MNTKTAKFFLLASLLSCCAFNYKTAFAETDIIVVKTPDEKSISQKALDALKEEYDSISKKIHEITEELKNTSLSESAIKAKHASLEKLEIAQEKVKRAYDKAVGNESKADSYWQKFKKWWHKQWQQ